MKILFTNKATFNRDGISNTLNSHVWSFTNPHASTETHFQSHFLGKFGAVLLEAK
jgi:hypothetical protein